MVKTWWKSHILWTLVYQNWSYDNERFFQCKISGK